MPRVTKEPFFSPLTGGAVAVFGMRLVICVIYVLLGPWDRLWLSIGGDWGGIFLISLSVSSFLA